MSDGRTADARLQRLLHILPAAMRDGGAGIEELADALDTSRERILEDLGELTSRVYYRPGGWPDDVQLLLESDRVRVVRAAGFERPVRFSREETLCLAMALRGTVASAHVRDADARLALLQRAEAHLGQSAGAGAGTAAATATPTADAIRTPERDPDLEGIRETLIVAARERRACALWYVKAGASDGSVRVVHPYAIAYAEGAWYAVSHCTVEKEIRVFRLDRVLAADFADGTFDVPDNFRIDDFVQGGRVYDMREGQKAGEVRIRYSARIARWVRERSEWESERHEESERLEEVGDGSVFVRHDVADPHWAVGHALSYGAEAEVVAPAVIRAMVRDAARRLAGPEDKTS